MSGKRNTKKKNNKPKKVETPSQRNLRLAKKREAERLRRERIKADEEQYRNYVQKERKRNETRRKNGQFKSIRNLSERDKRAMRKRWRKNKRNSRLNHKILVTETTSTAEIEDNSVSLSKC